MGFKADVIIWDYEERNLLHRLSLHKVKVEAVTFSPNELYVVTLGGQDDGSVVVWNLKTGQAVRITGCCYHAYPTCCCNLACYRGYGFVAPFYYVIHFYRILHPVGVAKLYDTISASQY